MGIWGGVVGILQSAIVSETLNTITGTGPGPLDWSIHICLSAFLVLESEFLEVLFSKK